MNNASDPQWELFSTALSTKINELRAVGMSFENAAKRVKYDYRSLPEAERIIDHLQAQDEQRVQTQKLERNRRVSNDERDYGWFAPFDSDDLVPNSWNLYRKKLLRDPGMAKVATTIDRESNDIVSSLADPARKVKKKGLVLGYVQSGKTANYTAVIAKAVASGYRFVVVLAGMYNNLRTQTQARLENDLFFNEAAVLTPNSGLDGFRDVEWLPLTKANDESGDEDLQRQDKPTAKQLLESPDKYVVVAVVKKQKNRLENLKDVLKKTRPEVLEKCPILIIDDEADQATPNTNRDGDELSTINRLIREIWAEVKRGTYVAYTATPFANLLMNPNEVEEMYPSDFVFAMDKPDGYMGSEAFFGTGFIDGGADEPRYERLREIPPEDSDKLKVSKKKREEGAELEFSDSLGEAIKWFILATAIRRARGHSGHSSMLVHISMLTDHHEAMRSLVDEYVGSLQTRWSREREAVNEEFRALFEWETDTSMNRIAVPLDNPEETRWDQVGERLDEVINDLQIIVDNGDSDERLIYDDENPRPKIVIGGNTLSRGLTLKDLVCSYFDRQSKTYDTLLQMGRWFGFRHGYEDLVRVWVTAQMKSDFAFLAGVEIELRDEIQRLIDDGLRPRDIGVRIRRHPGSLDVTSRMKMQFATEVQLSLQGQIRQTHRFSKEYGIISENRRVFDRLLRGLSAEGPVVEVSTTKPKQDYVYRDVDTQLVAKFFEDFQVAQSGLRSLQPDVTTQWMEEFGRERPWNVVLVHGGQENTPVEIGGHSVRLTRRAQYGKVDDFGEVSIKALLAPSDLEIDLNEVPKSKSVRARVTARELQLNGAGLLLLYMIDGESKPEKSKELTRQALDLKTDVPAFAVVFPTLEEVTQDAEYIAVRPDTPTDIHEE